MTRAVRVALAASLAALALGASGGAFAAGCKTPTTLLTPCMPVVADTTPVLDLTLVPHATAPVALIMPLAISESSAGDVVIDNADPISEVSLNYSSTAIYGYSSGGSVDITNQPTGSLEVISVYGNATGIEGYAYGDVGIHNAGDTYALSVYGSAIGLYGYSMTGDVSIDNSADVYAYSVYGLADGIFASGADVTVTNSGSIEAYGYTWAAGIEAQGTGTTSVNNDGDIYAASLDTTHAYGIYATGDVVQVGNTGNIEAQGYYATGIEAQGGSSVSITNAGDIVAGSSYYSALATGIDASSDAVDGMVTVTNTGSIEANGFFGGSGIVVTATGVGGSASVINSGSIYASQASSNGYGAYGIFASTYDGAATVDNTVDGLIEVYTPGTGTGAAALSFSGDTSVTNAGGIDVYGYDGANGIVSFAQNGAAYAGNSGTIEVASGYTGIGMDVGGIEGATANNSGQVTADGWYAYGIHATAGVGDADVTNSGSIDAIYTGPFAGRSAFGVFASSAQGDVSVDNSGDISTDITGQSVGIFGVSSYGDVGESSSGTISAYSYNSTAVGMFARADYGTGSVDNSGTISSESKYGSAFGVLARGSYADVGNSGDITVNGYAAATGIAASSYYGSTVTNTGGSIYAIAVGQAMGIDAQSLGGDVTVDNASNIDAIGIVLGGTGLQGYAYGNVVLENSGDIYAGSLYGNAIGIYGYSIAGDVAIDNSGAINAVSYYGLADGIFASGANVDVTNSGAVDVYGYTWSAGIEAQGADSVTVTNGGDITATAPGFYQGYVYSYLYQAGGVFAYAPGADAFGIYATGGAGGATVVNSGSIEVQGGYVTGIEVQSQGDVAITNSGDIVAGNGLNIDQAYYAPIQAVYTYYTGTQVATGINATSNGEAAHVGVINSGDITAEGIFGASGIAATAGGTGGSASVLNSGNIYASQYVNAGYGAYGIVVSADGNGSIDNSGDITVVSGGAAYGLAALSFAGDASVTNSGDIDVASSASKYYGATGILAFAGNGSAYVDNSGSVSAEAASIKYGPARAVDAQGQQGVTVNNTGSLYANGLGGAYGVYALSSGGDVLVTNADGGEIGFYSYIGSGFGVLGIAYTGDVAIDNDGTIEGYAYGQSAGVFGVGLEGDTTVTNSGSISVISGGDAAIGIFARADIGTASINNSGDITASDFGDSEYYYGIAAYGVLTSGAYAQVTNSGSIVADGNYYATGIAARSDYGTTVATSASSHIEASAAYVAVGIEGRSEYGNVMVSNAGSITAEAAGAVGIQAYSGGGNVTVANVGHVTADSEYGIALGVSGYAALGDTAVSNSGSIQANGYFGAYGMYAGAYGDVTVNNSGTVGASAAPGGLAAGVLMASLYGTATLNNAAAGVIGASGDEGYAFAVLGSDGVEVVNNSGRINGAVSLGGGDDVFNNRSGGVWDVGSTTSTDFGDGDDTINNLVGGTIRLDSGAIYLGGSVDGNAFNNAGTIKVLGDSLIDMGGASSGVPELMAMVAPNAVPSLNTVPLVNTGVIDMADGAADDSLTIVGDLGGNGALNIDVMVPDGPADMLYVDGSMVAGAVQTVNATFSPSLLLAAQTNASVDFALVSGNSTAGSFVGGSVIGYDASNFLDLGVVVTSQIDAANAMDDVFSVGVDVNGLNDTGTLAASIASGAAGMLNAQVGTFKQRMGVNPYGDAGKVMSAFFRTYTSEGDVNPTHAMANFGQGGHFDYDQSVWGREVGVNANLFGNLHAGVVLGTADGRQRLTGDGIGQNRMDGMTWGAYATWFAPQGFYVDVSGRWMAVDVRSTSAAGTLQTRAHTGAWNIEAGYEWVLGGVSIVPQLQYTRTKVDGIAPIHGSATIFESQGGTSSRGRIGVEVSKTFASGGLRWTPYGSINAIREFDGDMNYTVANVFNGGTSIQGTSTMAELGLGVQKGDWGFTIGANWLDGGAYKSTVGGQALVRFAW